MNKVITLKFVIKQEDILDVLSLIQANILSKQNEGYSYTDMNMYADTIYITMEIKK